MDFLILDMSVLADLTSTPIISGKPFFATAKANIDCEDVIINMKLEGHNISFNVFKSSKFPFEYDD